jgi:hypothetical protein
VSWTFFGCSCSLAKRVTGVAHDTPCSREWISKTSGLWCESSRRYNCTTYRIAWVTQSARDLLEHPRGTQTCWAGDQSGCRADKGLNRLTQIDFPGPPQSYKSYRTRESPAGTRQNHSITVFGLWYDAYLSDGQWEWWLIRNIFRIEKWLQYVVQKVIIFRRRQSKRIAILSGVIQSERSALFHLLWQFHSSWGRWSFKS